MVYKYFIEKEQKHIVMNFLLLEEEKGLLKPRFIKSL